MTDETAIKYAVKLKEFCLDKLCNDCPFLQMDQKSYKCLLRGRHNFADSPQYWRLGGINERREID